MRPYNYLCKDYSILTPIFKRLLVTPLMRFVPWSLPANIITIVSNAFFYLALYFSFNIHLLGKWNFILISILLMTYLIGDHLDGKQAKRTGTGSALGEFCDHFFDAFNTGILSLIIFNLFEVSNLWLVTSLVAVSYLAHVAIFYEQFKSGWLIFEKIGSLEGVLLSALLILVAFFEPIYNFYMSPLIFGFTTMEIFLMLISLGGVFTFFKTLNRTENIRYSIWMYMILIVTTGLICAQLFTFWEATIVLTLYSSLYLGRIMMGHLIDGIERSPGVFTPLFLTTIYFIPNLYTGDLFLVVCVYLAINILILIYKTFQALGKYWVWVNPSKK